MPPRPTKRVRMPTTTTAAGARSLPDIEDFRVITAACVQNSHTHSRSYHQFAPEEKESIRERLLEWYDVERREMPWRKDIASEVGLLWLVLLNCSDPQFTRFEYALTLTPTLLKRQTRPGQRAYEGVAAIVLFASTACICLLFRDIFTTIPHSLQFGLAKLCASRSGSYFHNFFFLANHCIFSI